ncbi:MAG TPA: glutamate ABC transporter substrate-binding protein [Nocardioidaceae bacterium]|jgi:glutamate transport system substrate-binding protein|nr:glutamate ABC transporter substrate-binding protein [Nocardioidaceae bacterium]
MRFTKSKAVIAAAGLALTLAACGGGGDSATSGHIELEAVENPEHSGTPAELAEAGKIKIGVKVDQPGIGFKEPGEDLPTGFDIEMGRIIAAQLGIDPDSENVEWVETISDNRESFIQNGTVDIVIASYSITDERRAVVGQAGPYYVTGQQLLIRKADDEKINGPEDLSGIKVCSVEGSTSLARVQDEYGADPVPFGTYSECVDQLENETVDAVTTDGAILAGYAAENDELTVVGEPFSEERYGIGYKKDDAEMCQFLNNTIEGSFEDGTWEEAFELTLGQASGVETPEQPTLDPCE